MYSLLSNVEQSALLLFLIMSLISAGKASKLIYTGSEKELYRKARKLRFWAVSLTVLSALVAASGITLAAAYHPAFWYDRLLLRTPLAVVPVALIWLMAIPRLRLLLLRTQAQTEQELDVARRRHATDTALVAPFKFAALGSLGAFYFILSPPVPFQLIELTLPLTMILFLGGILWVTQSSRNQVAAASPEATIYRPWSRRLRLTGIAAALAGVLSLPLLLAMDNSRLPGRMSMMAGVPDYGVIPGSSAAQALSHAHYRHAGWKPLHDAAQDTSTSVAALTGPQEDEPDQSFTLVARQATLRLSSGKEVHAWTYNGQIPGPELRMREGELIEVILVNEDIEAGVTIHWHGLNVPNAEDGVAGATQDAVLPGESHTYRFIADQVGTFWYHSHQHSKEAVEKGLFGALIVEAAGGAAGDGSAAESMPRAREDIIVLTHIWNGAGIAIGSSDTLERRAVAPGTMVKLRLFNTDNWVRREYRLLGTPFKVTAIDGVGLNEPEDLHNVSLKLATGGRYDVEFTMPDSLVYLSVDGSRSLGIVISPDGEGEAPDIPRAAAVFDPIRYGAYADTPFDADSPFDREFMMILDNKLAFYNGVPALYDTINGNVFPNTPMFVVREGELVKTTIVNRSAVDHPMHLHGHHMLVLSRNGERTTGSPWWSDTLDVAPGELYEVAFVADNPGVWMDHCHNLQHAAAGMTMHLMYEGVSSPFQIGHETHNHPE